MRLKQNILKYGSDNIDFVINYPSRPMKNRRKRNVFKQQENTPKQQEPEQQNSQQYQPFDSTLTNSQTGQASIANKFEEYYDNQFQAAKYEENPIYYENSNNKKHQDDQQMIQSPQKTHQPQEQTQTASKIKGRRKRALGKKKRDFLDVQGQQQQPQQQKQKDQKDEYSDRGQDQPEVVKKSYQKQKYKQKEESQEDQMEQVIAKKKNQNIEKPDQTLVSFKTLLDESGDDKQLRRRIYYAPLAPKQRSVCYFKRYQSGLSETYQLIGEDHRPLIFCENQRGSIGANMYLSMTKQMDKNSPSYLGKLRGNSTGSAYYLYDVGLTPSNKLDRSQWRITMATVEYENNFMGMKGPRKLKITTPKVKSEQQWDAFKLGDNEGLDKLPPTLTLAYRNKQPKWNQKLKSYALNFGGRVKMASIKNFILVDDSFKSQQQFNAPNVLVFGKIDENTFSLQFGHPLSLFQAFGVVMSQFDFKLNCQ